MNELHRYWMSAIEEKNMLADELINESRALLFSVRIVAKMFLVTGLAAANESTDVSNGFRIGKLCAEDACSLSAEMQSTLNNLAAKISEFIPLAGRVVDASVSQIPAGDDPSLSALRTSLIRSLAALEDLITHQA